MGGLFIVWNQVHQTGIPIIDEQHRGIVSSINSLFFFMRNKHPKVVTLPTIMVMEQYAKVHFLTEEALLREAGYPDFAGHQSLHQKFAEKTRAMALAEKRLDESAELLQFLKDWWLHHINEQDRQYLPHVKAFLGKRAAERNITGPVGWKG